MEGVCSWGGGGEGRQETGDGGCLQLGGGGGLDRKQVMEGAAFVCVCVGGGGG